MVAVDYSEPVNRLLTYGDPRKKHTWPDYVADLTLGSEHIPDLIHMVRDFELNHAGAETTEVWAPLHAWRALGQLKAEAAIDPLLEQFEADWEWASGEMPKVFGLIGSPAIPALKTYLADKARDMYARVTAADCLAAIGNQHPETRTECVEAITQQLEQFNKNSPEFNAFLVSTLIDLKATEAAPLIERVFASKRITHDIAGDWGDVQVALGLKSRSEALGNKVTMAEQFGHIPPGKGTAPSGFGSGNPPGKKKKGR